MANPLDATLTGKTRHRVQKIGFWNPKQVLIMQHEVRGFKPEFTGGSVGGHYTTWWVDSKPEWIMEGASE